MDIRFDTMTVEQISHIYNAFHKVSDMSVDEFMNDFGFEMVDGFFRLRDTDELSDDDYDDLMVVYDKVRSFLSM